MSCTKVGSTDERKTNKIKIKVIKFFSSTGCWWDVSGFQLDNLLFSVFFCKCLLMPTHLKFELPITRYKLGSGDIWENCSEVTDIKKGRKEVLYGKLNYVWFFWLHISERMSCFRYQTKSIRLRLSWPLYLLFPVKSKNSFPRTERGHRVALCSLAPYVT